MADEDQTSHFDDPEEEQEPIKVSVTFKPQEQATDENNNVDQPCSEVEPSSQDSLKREVTLHDSEAEEPSLPTNPPVTPIPSSLDVVKVNGEGLELEKQEVLEGWKGYSNNIYIQPIIVNHAKCEECHCQTKSNIKRRLTSEDLRKQMRLREANSWIKKHNERIKSTGTLRTKSQFQEKQREQPEAINETLRLTKDNDDVKPNQRKSKTKIHKGFVCRTWATSFLPKDAKKNENDDEFTPFFVRKYVDKSKLNSSDHDKQSSSPLAEKNRTNSDIATREPENTSSQTAVDELNEAEVEPEKPYIDELINRRKGKGMKSSMDTQNFPSVSYEFICSCGQPVNHKKKVNKTGAFSGSKQFRRERSRSQNSKVRFSVALPIKQFPPINPLEQMKKPNFPARRNRELLPTRRPHTVDTATLSKGVILVNGHYNLPHFMSRPTTTPLENRNKERQKASGVKFEQDCDGRSKRFDEVIESSRKLKSNATPQCVLNEERDGCNGRGLHRSLSDPRSVKLAKNQCRHSVECLTVNRRRIRTPPHSLNSEDGDSITDSNDTGLGSEIEYSFDGLAKLDVYLQPRGANLHENSS